MKNYIALLLCFSILILNSCSTRNYLDAKTVDNLINNKEFTFMAKSAHPLDYSVISVMNSLPAPSASSRIFNLDYGYDIEIKNGTLTATLPYFGRMYTPSMDREKESMRFTSKNYEITKTEGKKHSKILTIVPSDVGHVRRIIMEIFPSGSAYVSIDANDRQPISYNGYLMKNNETK